MIEFKKFTLPNGLRVVHHYDASTPMVALNVVYDVGSKDEDPSKTGFAHLFEHLMFGGSVNIPNYDEPLQKAGGENNAWTSSDLTNYYLTVPGVNVETGFWLESDRMLGLAFSEESLAVQKKVVVEEFKQRYLNQPYGDSGLLLYPMAYEKHPYRWPTIGQKVAHIEDAILDDVKDFFYKHYAPNNAILAISGNISFEKAKQLSEKWFGPIEKRAVQKRKLPNEPVQTQAKYKKVERAVPQNAIYKAWHMSDRKHPHYYATDLATDILSNGYSSRLYQRLVKNEAIFSEINAYISGTCDAGLLYLNAKLLPDISFDLAEEKIEIEIQKLLLEPVSTDELNKVRNKLEANFVYGNMSYVNKAMNLAYYELIGDAGLINSEMNRYTEISPADIQDVLKQVFDPNNCSTLHYQSKSL